MIEQIVRPEVERRVREHQHLADILRKVIDHDHTIVNEGGYLVMEGAGDGMDGIWSAPTDRIVDLTPQEMAALNNVGIPVSGTTRD